VPDVDEPSLFINNAAIYPDLRGKGLGAAMVAHAKDVASKVGAKIIRLDTYGGNLGTPSLELAIPRRCY
jgi:GNAT superfamily N-acetyltransferase